MQKPKAAERAAFLDHACRANPSLRAALDELLESHFGADGCRVQIKSSLPPQQARASRGVLECSSPLALSVKHDQAEAAEQKNFADPAVTTLRLAPVSALATDSANQLSLSVAGSGRARRSRGAFWTAAALYRFFARFSAPQNLFQNRDGFGFETAHWMMETGNRKLQK